MDTNVFSEIRLNGYFVKVDFLSNTRVTQRFQFLSNNLDKNTDFNQVEQANDIRVAHPYTTIAGRLSDELFLIRTVDVDVAFLGIRIVLVQAIEPENP